MFKAPIFSPSSQLPHRLSYLRYLLGDCPSKSNIARAQPPLLLQHTRAQSKSKNFMLTGVPEVISLGSCTTRMFHHHDTPHLRSYHMRIPSRDIAEAIRSEHVKIR